MSALRYIPPDPAHASLIRGYWCADDWEGTSAGRPITTAPSTGGLLTIHVGSPNGRWGEGQGPRVSLTGLFTQVHCWQSRRETSFVMVMLSAHGLGRLFPTVGKSVLDNVIDLSAILGDSEANRLGSAVKRSDVMNGRVGAIEAWLDSRRHTVAVAAREQLFHRAVHELSKGKAVHEISTGLGVSRRTLGMWTTKHLGISPKSLSTLARIEQSVRATQLGFGDHLEGYSDQSHCVRDWQRLLKTTPTKYMKSQSTDLVKGFWHGAQHSNFERILYI